LFDFIASISMIVGGAELMGQANVCGWGGFSLVWGLTGFSAAVMGGKSYVRRMLDSLW
jgi:hypothetical protein